MALSMFLRTPACASRLFSQQAMRYASQPSLMPAITQRAVASLLSVQNHTAKVDTPIYNVVRSYRTAELRGHADEKPHNHSKLWVVEKVTAALLVPLIPLGLLIPNRLFDSLMAILIVAHSFWGLEAVVVEYARVIVVGETVPKVAMGVVYFVVVLMFGGMLYLINNDIGMCRGFWRVWRNMRKPTSAAAKTKSKPAKVISFKPSLGLEAIAVDYVRASIFGPVIPKIAIGLVYLLSIATLGGLFYVITHDIGIANSVRRLWSVRSEQKA